MSQIIAAIVFLIALVGWHYYDKSNAVDAAYARGLTAAQVKNQQQHITDLTAIIESTQTLVNHAEMVSQKIEQSINTRESADQKTTQEIQRALSRTSNARVNCQFDTDVMQQITTARDRANQAAAFGISYPVPTGTRTD